MIRILHTPLLALALVVSLVAGACSAGVGSNPTAPPVGSSPLATDAAPSGQTTGGLAPPAATPLAEPPAGPASDGTSATISTELGDIVIELYTDSAPVATENFINLAEAGYYEGVVFHRLVPGFVIQGGDPTGSGMGGPGYTIPDEPVVGQYGRGTVAMARTQAPDSQGSQFFIVLDDEAEEALESARTYTIFGEVIEGMDVVDAIAATPNAGSEAGNQALEPVAMQSVTVARP
ncbi:MAG: peptidylprolyl isomerase [Chloroflexota bacterium]|nr:peptidylprolyl isomerase [Chloroflexota bacterium]